MSTEHMFSWVSKKTQHLSWHPSYLEPLKYDMGELVTLMHGADLKFYTDVKVITILCALQVGVF